MKEIARSKIARSILEAVVMTAFILVLLFGAGLSAGAEPSTIPAAMQQGAAAVKAAETRTAEALVSASAAVAVKAAEVKRAAVAEADKAFKKAEPEIAKALSALSEAKAKEQETLTSLLQALEKAVK